MADDTGTASPAQPVSDSAQSAPDRGVPLDQLFKSFTTDQQGSAGTGANRSVALDQLFKQIKTNAPKPIPTAVASAPPKAHTSSLIAHQHQTATKGQGNKVMIAKAPSTKGAGSAVSTQDAVYHGTNGGENMVAVSTGGSGDAGGPVVEASLDHPGQQPTYKAGDHMVISLKANHDCNVLVFDFDNQGNLTQLYPNAYEKDATMHAGQTVALGGDSSEYTLDIDGSGLERIFVYASPIAQGPITLAMAPVPNTPFRAVNMKAEEFDKMVAMSATFKEFDAQKGDKRGVHVKGKDGAAQQVAFTAPGQASNKVELVFKITK
jgi:hypothetical protein